jgi:hypothetical protein
MENHHWLCNLNPADRATSQLRAVIDRSSLSLFVRELVSRSVDERVPACALCAASLSVLAPLVCSSPPSIPPGCREQSRCSCRSELSRPRGWKRPAGMLGCATDFAPVGPSLLSVLFLLVSASLAMLASKLLRTVARPAAASAMPRAAVAPVRAMGNLALRDGANYGAHGNLVPKQAGTSAVGDAASARWTSDLPPA